MPLGVSPNLANLRATPQKDVPPGIRLSPKRVFSLHNVPKQFICQPCGNPPSVPTPSQFDHACSCHNHDERPSCVIHVLSLINWIVKGKRARARFLFVRLGTSERNSTEAGALLMTNGNGGNRSCCGSLFCPLHGFSFVRPPSCGGDHS